MQPSYECIPFTEEVVLWGGGTQIIYILFCMLHLAFDRIPTSIKNIIIV